MPRPKFRPPDPPLPEEIRYARHKAGLTMAQAARLIQVSASAWESYEYERYKMPAPSWRLFLILTGQEKYSNK